MSLFDGYEREYCDLSAAISRKTAGASGLNGEERKAAIAEVEGDISEADALIRRMDLEARSLNQSQKAPLLAKIREYKADLNNLKRDVKAAGKGGGGDAARMELGMAGGYAGSTSEQRQRLLDTTDQVRQTGDRITQGRQTLLETEELGVSILQDLHRQRQGIMSTRSTLHGADDQISESRRVLSTMGRRLMTNKLIMLAIILVLVGAIGMVVWYKYIN